jgi:hypothetical protein
MSQFENMKKTGRCAATKKNLSLNILFEFVLLTWHRTEQVSPTQGGTVSNAAQ